MTEPFQSRSPLRFARGELVFGYRLVRKLGEGSFGSVWLAANEKGFEWALKFVSLQGNGGVKEFKALQLIKDRKINNTNLLKLIDYGLLDHDGNSLATSTSSPLLNAAPEKPATPAADVPRAEPANPTPSQGTMMPVVEKAAHRTEVEHLAARETQGATNDTKTSEKHRASWLVIVMEVGQATLHQLQLQQTQRELAGNGNSPRAVTRMGATGVRSPTLKDGQQPAVDPVEEPLAPLPVSLVLPYLEQAARGLDYLHRHEIVHRDIKPQNIILVADDAKVCDYGLASEFSNSTATTIGCTPAYAAPEAINNRPVPASDQYSLAVTYIELVTGRWPFFGVTQTAIYREKDEGKHNLGFIPKASVREVLKRALSKLPENRFPTCGEFMQKLAAAENSATSVFPPKPFLVAASVLLAVVIAGFGWAYQSEAWNVLQSSGKSVQQAKVPAVEIPAGEPDPVPGAQPTDPAPAPMPVVVTSVTPPTQSPVVDADNELTAAFANSNLPLRDLLPIFERYVSATDDPSAWFARLEEKANANSAAQSVVEQWLRKNLNRTPRLPIFDTAEYQAFDQEFRAASLQRLWARSLSTPAEFDAALSSDSLKLNDANPLAVLLRVDLEMRLAGNTAKSTQRDDWDGRIESALIPTLSGQAAAQRELVVTYLNALQFVAKPTAFDPRELGDRLQKLFNVSPQPAWLTTDRKQALAETLGMVAIHELGKNDRDLLTIQQWKLAANVRLSHLLTIADLHGLQSDSLAAAQAMTRASRAIEKNDSAAAEWRSIANLASAALEDDETNELLKTQNRRLLLFYVAKLAALKTARPDSDDFRRAVKGLATLLRTPQVESQPYFDFDQESQASDSSLFRLFILPVLGHPAVAGDGMQFDAESLATLWAARGRLLQRTPAVFELVEPLSNQKLSQSVQTLLLSHQAFEQAARYDDLAARNNGQPRSDKYSKAAASALAALPKLVAPQSTPLADMIAIVEAVDPNGTANEPELLRLGGYVRRQQASLEPDRRKRGELAQQSIVRYSKAISLAEKQQAKALLAAACTELSELHLQMAGWTDLQRVDYDPLADQPAQPPLGTKSYYLWRAAALANQALSVADQSQRTNANLALAGAHEQMAVALGLVGNYQRALEILDREEQTLKTNANRSLLQSTRGRCRLRQAQEMFCGLSPDERNSRLLAAGADFETALGDRRSTKQWATQDAETLYFLAETKIALAAQNSAELAQAEAALRTALEAADPHSPRLSQYRWRLLLVINSQSDTRAAKQYADEIFASAKDLKEQDPAAISGIAITTAGLFSEPSKLLRWLPASGSLHQQWRATDGWKLEGARLYSEAARLCSEASLQSSAGELRKSAQQLAFDLPPGSSQRLLAEAAIQENLARQLCREFERIKPPSSSATQLEGQQRSYEGDRLAKAGIATAAIRDCCQKHFNCQEPRIQSLLTEIGRTSVADLQAGKCLPEATVLEKRALWKYVTAAPALDARERFLEMCGVQTSSANGDAGNREQLAKTTQDLLKPAVFFTAYAQTDSRLNAFLQKQKSLLDGEKKK